MEVWTRLMRRWHWKQRTAKLRYWGRNRPVWRLRADTAVTLRDRVLSKVYRGKRRFRAREDQRRVYRILAKRGLLWKGLGNRG